MENPKNPNIIFHKTPDPATFPQAPTKPKIVDRRATSVTISWRSNTNTGRSPLIGYTIEYFSFDLETGWVVAAHRVTSETYTIHNLKPDTSYVFLIRAENSDGLSHPSPVSERVRTLRLIRYVFSILDYFKYLFVLTPIFITVLNLYTRTINQLTSPRSKTRYCPKW